MSNPSFDSGSSAPVCHAFQAYKEALANYVEYLEQKFDGDEGRYFRESCRLLEVSEIALSALFATPAINAADVALKLEISIGDVDEVGEDPHTLALLRRGLMALRSGNKAMARMLVAKALDGETNYPFAYDGALSAFHDLNQTGLAVQP
jgi:hypothetical protein